MTVVIPEFWCGVIGTVLTELLILFVALAWGMRDELKKRRARGE